MVTRIVKILSLENKSVLADRCIVAESFVARLKGLIGKKDLETGQGLLIVPCNDIHMWFMSIPIDVAFIQLEKRADGAAYYLVTSVRENLKPWRLLPVRDGRASETIELPVGTIQRCKLRPGDRLCIS